VTWNPFQVVRPVILDRFNSSVPLAGLQHSSPAGYQVDDEHDKRDNQQQMDQAASNVQAESNNPQNQKNYKDRPEHMLSFLSLGAQTQKERCSSLRVCERQQ
jgi:hypothetical protein